MKLSRTTPCGKCPWRRNSQPGYLGEDNPVDFLTKTDHGDGRMPCHKGIDYTDPDWMETQIEDAPYCVGGLQYLNNTLKRPRDPEMAAACDMVGRNDNVFAWHHEFLTYHLGRYVSAEEANELLWKAFIGMLNRQQGKAVDNV